jgi:Response regulator containing a CheY-like receiver domain and a GGDEF domain
MAPPLPCPPVATAIWKFAVLDDVAKRAVQQWQLLQHIRHPYQTVQLLDQSSSIANLPLFAKVTNGKFRICEIADEFKQHIFRTAQKLDKLAESRTVAILPLTFRQARSQDQETAPDDLEASNIPQILVVDDSPIQLQQFGELLKSWGYRTHLISDPRTVCQVMLERKPNLVFMDINMPSISGFELIKEIRREALLKDTPLILITSADNMANKFRANWAHCKFLPKSKSNDDIHVQEFRDHLRRILQDIAPLKTDNLV